MEYFNSGAEMKPMLLVNLVNYKFLDYLNVHFFKALVEGFSHCEVWALPPNQLLIILFSSFFPSTLLISRYFLFRKTNKKNKRNK